MKTVITNGIIITMNRDMDMYPEGYVVLEDSRISEVGPMEALEHRMTGWGGSRQEGISIIDAEHGIVMPGMVNTHCHMGMIPFPWSPGQWTGSWPAFPADMLSASFF